MKIQIPVSTFPSHPEGEHIGTIIDVVDQGMHETLFGQQQHIVSAVIESKTASRGNGEPLLLRVDTVLSSNPKSRLFKLRQDLLHRPLTVEERLEFDPGREMTGRKVSYLVEHDYRDDGTLFPRLVTWSLVEEVPTDISAREKAPAAEVDNVSMESPFFI